MKSITVKSIIEFLMIEGIPFQLSNNVKDDVYTIASIFNPQVNGFYYLVGSIVPLTVTDSLLMVGLDFPKESIVEGNVGLFIDADPQRVYYKLLSHYHSVQSTGVISDQAIIHPQAIIGQGVQIDPFTIISMGVIIGDNTIIRSHCTIQEGSVVGENVVIDNQSMIGVQGVAWIWNETGTEKIVQPQLGGVTIEDNCFLGANSIIVRGSLNENSIIGKGSLLAPGCRIGHGTKIGSFVHIANNVSTGGNTNIGDYSFVGSSAVFRPKVKIHNHTIVGTGAVVVKNTSKEGMTLMGVPATESETKNNPSGMPSPHKHKPKQTSI